ncbi:hypothetical protein IMZ48_26225 [Candidatus Bathyarchaeota archaeon]|nr:hypothetical protein [Candidatus Bathyarchaeota archaeon]
MIQTDSWGRQFNPQQSNWGGSPAAPAPAAAAPLPASVSEPFQQALAALSGTGSDVEKMYQSGKRRTLSDIAMQSINAGMGNTLNMPAAGVAYDEANRAPTNLAAANAKVGVLTGLGQTAAGIYGTNVGAETSRYGISTQAGTAASGQQLDYNATMSGQALSKYLAELELKYKYADTSAVAAKQRLSNPNG